MTDENVDALIADVDRGVDPNAIRARAAALHRHLTQLDIERMEEALARLPRRSGLLTMGGG